VTIRLPHPLIALACAAAFGAGCGGDEEEGAPIPQGSVGELERQMTSIQNRIEFARDASPAEAAGACDDIEEDNIPSVDRLLARVPQDVDSDVRDALQRSFDRLFELARSECGELSRKEDTTETTPTEPVPPPTVEETTPTEPEETETLEQGESGKPKKEKKEKDRGGGGQQAPGQDGDGGAVAPEED
jgi:hypothetical protein